MDHILLLNLVTFVVLFLKWHWIILFIRLHCLVHVHTLRCHEVVLFFRWHCLLTILIDGGLLLPKRLVHVIWLLDVQSTAPLWQLIEIIERLYSQDNSTSVPTLKIKVKLSLGFFGQKVAQFHPDRCKHGGLTRPHIVNIDFDFLCFILNTHIEILV